MYSMLKKTKNAIFSIVIFSRLLPQFGNLLPLNANASHQSVLAIEESIDI
jgi:hypothetical protein